MPESKKLLLIIDDEEDFVQMQMARLSKSGYEVMSADDGVKGLERIRQHRPDLILLDYLMPGLDGSEICQRIKGDDEFKKIPVIFMTASPQFLTPEKLQSTQVDDYLVKPFESSELLAKIKHFIG